MGKKESIINLNSLLISIYEEFITRKFLIARSDRTKSSKEAPMEAEIFSFTLGKVTLFHVNSLFFCAFPRKTAGLGEP